MMSRALISAKEEEFNLEEIKEFIGLLVSHHLGTSKERRCFSPEIFGKKIHVCTRCSSLVMGLIISILIYTLYPLSFLPQYILLLASILMITPMGIDGGLQYLRLRESNRKYRIATGVNFGAGTALVMTGLDPHSRLILFMMLVLPFLIIVLYPIWARELIRNTLKVI